MLKKKLKEFCSVHWSKEALLRYYFLNKCKQHTSVHKLASFVNQYELSTCTFCCFQLEEVQQHKIIADSLLLCQYSERYKKLFCRVFKMSITESINTDFVKLLELACVPFKFPLKEKVNNFVPVREVQSRSSIKLLLLRQQIVRCTKAIRHLQIVLGSQIAYLHTCRMKVKARPVLTECD